MTTPIARFHVNGIEIGSLPRAMYDDIRRGTRRDPALYLAYVFNVAGGLLRAVQFFVRAVPLCLFLAIAMLVLLDPDSFTSLVEAFRAAEPADVTKAVRTVLHWIFWVLLVLLPVVILLRPRYFAIQDPFSEAVSHEVRRLLEVPTEGKLTVTFYDAPEQHG